MSNTKTTLTKRLDRLAEVLTGTTNYSKYAHTVYEASAELDGQAEPVALSAIAEWDTAPAMTKYGAGMMQAVLAISQDETLTLTCHKDALRLPSPLRAATQPSGKTVGIEIEKGNLR